MYAREILTAGDHLRRLVDDLLDLSRVEKGLNAGFMDYVTKPIDIASTLNKIRSILERSRNVAI